MTYTGANGTDPGNVTFSLVNANLEYETLQIRDTNFPGNEGEDKPNVQTSVPYATVDQTTHYKEVDSSKYTEGQPYKPTGSETDLASYTQKVLLVNNSQLQEIVKSLVTNKFQQQLIPLKKHLVSLVRVLSVKNLSNFKVEQITTT